MKVTHHLANVRGGASVDVWNFMNQPISLRGFVVNDKGALIKAIGGLEGRVPPNAKNYTLTGFSLSVYGAGNRTYKLFLDDTNGKPNGIGEEHWSNVTVEVKPTNGTKLGQVSAECSDIHFDFRDRAYRATLTCRVYLYNPAREMVRVRDITVLPGYSLGDLESVRAGGLTTGKWVIRPESFSLASQGTEAVAFSLPMEISSWIPISVADATEVVLKDGEYTKVSFTYTLGYTYDGSNWKQLEGHVSDYVQVTMDAKTVAADYILSGINAVVDPNTMLSVSAGSFRLSGLNINMKIGFDPWAFFWNGFLKPYILEHI